MNRRGFLKGILAAGVAPAIVRASSLMPVKGYEMSAGGILIDNRTLIIDLIEARIEQAREAMAVRLAMDLWEDPTVEAGAGLRGLLP